MSYVAYVPLNIDRIALACMCMHCLRHGIGCLVRCQRAHCLARCLTHYLPCCLAHGLARRRRLAHCFAHCRLAPCLAFCLDHLSAVLACVLRCLALTGALVREHVRVVV